MAHVTVGVGKSKVCRTGMLEIQAGINAAVLRQNFFSRKPQVLLLRPSADLVRPTLSVEGNLLYLQSSDCRY